MDYSGYVTEFFQMTKNVNRAEMQKGLQNILKGESCFLLYLSEHGGAAVPGDICAALDVTHARTTALTKTLEKKGLIIRRSDDNDRRRAVISLSDAGRAYIESKVRCTVRHIKETFEMLGEDDTRELLRILRRMGEFNNAHCLIPGQGPENL